MSSNRVIPTTETKKAASDKLNDLDKNYIDLEINCAAITRRLKDALGDMSDLDDKLKEVRCFVELVKGGGGGRGALYTFSKCSIN